MNNPNWRLIPLLEAPGAIQMAIDLWLLEQYRQGKQPPTLRFYTWSPTAISLGYHQRYYPEFWHNLTWQGKPLDLVRRPSGGRAVLHQGDLSYAVITSDLPGKRREAYQYLCEFLIQGWRSLGVELHYGKTGRGYIHNPSCFSTATDADLITTEGQKLIGSAQLRKGKTILQHGSMRLSTEQELFNQIFGPVNLQTSENCVNLSTKPSISQILLALTNATQECFQVKLATQPLSKEEWQEICLLGDHAIEENFNP